LRCECTLRKDKTNFQASTLISELDDDYEIIDILPPSSLTITSQPSQQTTVTSTNITSTTIERKKTQKMSENNKKTPL
jgi:hypothetical protein